MKKLFIFFALIFVSSMLFAESSDEMACKFARKVGTVDVWKNYLETFPGGSCAFEAESVLKMNKQATPREMETNNPQDVNACSMARQKNRPDVWRIYLESYPHGICAFEAKMAITELEEKARADQQRLAAAAARKNCDSDDRIFPCKDSSTGLTWSELAPNGMNWRSAINYCENLNEGGYNNWRLPNIDELRTLIKNCSKTVPYGSCTISERNGHLSWNFYEREVRSDSCECSSGGNYSRLGDSNLYWSSSLMPEIRSKNNEPLAWCVAFYNASLGISSVSEFSKVRCVR